jgi:MFS superfamily sulfate permease-like transporter
MASPIAMPSRPGLPWSDLVAAASLAGLLLPEGVAYAHIAGLPSQAGVLALFAGLISYGVFGSSRVAVVSATSSSAAVLAASLGAPEGFDPVLRPLWAAGLVLLTGVLFLLAAMARLGAVSNFISKPVLRGFALGLAWTIILRQLAAMCGVHLGTGQFFPGLWQWLQVAQAWDAQGLALGLVALLLLSAFARVERLPGGFVVLALSIVVGQSGWAGAHGIALTGPIDLGLQRLPAVPALSLDQWARLGELAFAVALILYAESYTSIRSFAAPGSIAPNRDLVALGIANVASALLRGMPVGAGFSATAANVAAGARSRWSGLAACAMLALVAAFALRWVALTPEPVLAAVVVHALRRSADPRALQPFFAWKRDRLVAAAAVVAVLLLGVLHGLLLGVALSLAATLQQLSMPRVSWLARLPGTHDFVDAALHPEAVPTPGLLVARPEVPLFFANAERVFDALRRHIAALGNGPAQAVRGFVLSLEESPDLDSASIEALGDFAALLARRGIDFRIARAKDVVREVLATAALPAVPPSSFTPWSVDDAVADLLAAPARHAGMTALPATQQGATG